MENFNKDLKKNWQLYVLFIPTFIWIVMFVFIPFATNIVMSLQDYSPTAGLFGSDFVWFDNYIRFFSSGGFWQLLGNTLFLNLTVLGIGFPLAIVLAICVSESKSKVVKGLTQTATFLPFFISAVIVTNITIEFLKADTGMLVNILVFFGFERENLLNDPSYFRFIYTAMDVWQTLGYNSLIYLAALSAIDLSLYEAASIDGAGKFKKILNVTLPSLMPTIVITLILRLGKLVSMGYEKVLLLQNADNLEVSEIISTFVYNVALSPAYGTPDYGTAATIGIFDAVVSIILVFSVNRIAKKLSDTKLW